MSGSILSDNTGSVLFMDNTIVIAGNNAHLGQPAVVSHSTTVSEYLQLLPIAQDAMHNSARSGREPVPRCEMGTREKVQGDINDWILPSEGDPMSTTNVLWLTGPAGAGKTAVAGSIADYCYEKGILAGSFFFSARGSQETRSKRYLISTLAYQIFQHKSLLGATGRALESIRHDPSIFTKLLKDQLEALIIQPLRDFIKNDKTIISALLPQVIIIDGLDEVHGAVPADRRAIDEQDEILSALLQAAYDPFFPFRLLIASRQEPNIENKFSELAPHITKTVVLDETYRPGADIKIFLKSRFTRIQLSRYSKNQVDDLDWPGETIIDQLVENSSGQFAYPAAIIRFIDNDKPPPKARLKLVLNWRPSSARQEDDPLKPFEHLDRLYEGIISDTPEPQLTVKWLRAINRSPGLPALFWRQFLASSEDEVDSAFQGLNSLVYIPPSDDHEAPYGFYHQSLMDFLEDGSRSRNIPSNPVEDFSQFVQKRFIETLKHKGPPIDNLAGEEKEAFISSFLSAVECLHPTYDEAHLFSKHDLMSCDMGWWMDRLIGETCCKPSTINRSFQFIHSPCPWYRCTKACKHWRKGILSVCKDRGWDTPSRAVLIRNRFTRVITIANRGLVGYPTEVHFRPPPADTNEASIANSN
ncbi:hypothetical protein NMY22_g14736 [Coprinellus aureogranulatus]|nr:hypothetical protein NMY22_g14736 [Coprinellus aureogranulatus]